MEVERNLGPQPIAVLMNELGLAARDLVEASSEQLTHKMVSRALKGRRLTQNTKAKVHRALESAAARSFAIAELFNY